MVKIARRLAKYKLEIFFSAIIDYINNIIIYLAI